MEANTKKKGFGGNMGGNDLSHMKSQKLEDFLSIDVSTSFANVQKEVRARIAILQAPLECSGLLDSAEKTN